LRKFYVRKSQKGLCLQIENLQSVTFAECPQSNKPFKSANLRKLFADRPPLLSSQYACEKLKKMDYFFRCSLQKGVEKAICFLGFLYYP
jgi:hypothetical protein